MFNYYCLDWAVFVLVLVHIWLLGNKNKNGFLVGILSCVFSMCFSFLAGSFPNLLLGACLLLMHIRAYVRWTKAEKIGLTICSQEKPPVNFTK